MAQGLKFRRYGNLPATAEEQRYLDRREALRLGAAATRYLRRHARVSAYWDVRDDWPRGAYAAVFVADDPAKHRAAIKRLAANPRFTRVVRVRYSDRERDRARRRIERDEKALKRAGFTVVLAETEIGTDRVDVALVTHRTDHAAYFKRRYGAMVKTVVLARERSVQACTGSSRRARCRPVPWPGAGPRIRSDRR